MNRRSFVAAVGTASLGVAATAATAAREEENTTERQYLRGESDTIATEQAGDETATYLEEREMVRYVRSWRSRHREEETDDKGPLVIHPEEGASRLPADHETPDTDEREPVYGLQHWDDWAEMRARHAAAEAAADHVAEVIDIDGGRISGGSSSGAPPEESVAVVTVALPDDHERVPVEEVAAATPATVETTYRLDGREFHTEAPVFATVMRVKRNIATSDVSDLDLTVKSPGDIDSTFETGDGDETGEGSTDGGGSPGDGGDETGGSTTSSDDGTRDGNLDNSDDETGESSPDNSDDETGEAEADDTGPGFGPGVVLTGLGTLGYLARRRLAGEGAASDRN